ncbi:MAG: MotA/TolQ/ExbB proton channel family protein, partial [Planctomycetales bacterium]
RVEPRDRPALPFGEPAGTPNLGEEHLMSSRIRNEQRWSRVRSTSQLLALVAPLAFMAPLAAQDAEPKANPAGEAAKDKESTVTFNVLQMISDSGTTGIAFMLVLFTFSFVAVMVTAERAVNLTRQKVLPDGFVSSVKDLVHREEDQPNEFQVICDRYKAPISRILHAGLLRAGRPLPEVEKGMEDAVSREVSTLRARNRPLGVIASVAPLVGLLGTVVGMIFAFMTASQVGTGKAESLAEGIYLALLTTAAGLTIAIPCLLLSAYYNGKIEKLMAALDEVLMDTMPCFTRMEEDAEEARRVRRAQQDAEAGAESFADASSS